MCGKALPELEVL